MRVLTIMAALVATILAAPASAAPTTFQIKAPASAGAALSGRLLVFARPLAEARADAEDGRVTEVDAGAFNPRSTAVAAQDVAGLAPGATVTIDADVTAFPKPFSQLAPGRYAVQAVLDADGSYNYGGRGPGDRVTPVVELDLPQGGALALGDTLAPAADPTAGPPASLPDGVKAAFPMARRDIHPLAFRSASLSAFWGRPTFIKGWVLTPPGYDAAKDRYPTVYFTHGFGGDAARL